MAHWGGVGNDLKEMGKNVVGGFRETGHAFVGGGKAATGVLGSMAGAVNWMASAAARVVTFPVKVVSKILPTRPVGYIGAAVITVGGAIAAAVGISHWRNNQKERAAQHAAQQMQEAEALARNIAQNKDRIVEMQAAVADPNASANNAAKVAEAAKQQQAGASRSA